MMQIAIERLADTPTTRKWVATIFSDPANIVDSMTECTDEQWQADFCRDIASGRVVALLPAVDGVAAGLFSGSQWENGIWSCHQVIMARFRGWTGFRIATACARYAFEHFPDIKHLVGIVPSNNQASLICALRAGFKEIGVWPAYYKDQQGIIVLKERD